MANVYVKKISDFANLNVDLSNINKTRKEYLEKLASKSQKTSYYAWVLLKEKVIEEFNLDIDELQLIYNEHGKPLFKEFYFNISHSKNLIAVGLSSNPIGVDIQVIEGKDVSKISKKLEIEEDDIPAFYKVFSSIEAKGKKEGVGIFPSSLKSKNYTISKQLMISDETNSYVLSVDCEDEKININY